MNEIGTFDILGPNMIGPSSSHTAGALRIAFIAGKMVEKPAAVRFVLYGSFARTYHGHGTDRALVPAYQFIIADGTRMMKGSAIPLSTRKRQDLTLPLRRTSQIRRSIRIRWTSM